MEMFSQCLNAQRKRSRISVAISICLLMSIISGVTAGRNRRYTFPGYICGGRPREIDGAVLNSGHSSVYSDTLCVTRFVSDDDLFTSKRLMLKFEMFSITDPNFELTILGTSGSAIKLDYRSSRPPVIYSRDKYLELRLRKTSNTGYSFKIIITSFKDGSYCSDFTCMNGKCIDRDLKCDGVDHCFDNSDEEPSTCVAGVDLSAHLDSAHRSVIVMPLIITGMIVLVIAVTVCAVIYRRRRMGAFYSAAARSGYNQPVNLQPLPPGAYSQQPPLPQQSYAPPLGSYPQQSYVPSPGSYPPHSYPQSYPSAPSAAYAMGQQMPNQSEMPPGYSAAVHMSQPPPPAQNPVYPSAPAGSYPIQPPPSEMKM